MTEALQWGVQISVGKNPNILAQRDSCIITHCPWTTYILVTRLLLHSLSDKHCVGWNTPTEPGSNYVRGFRWRRLVVITVFTTCESPAAPDLWFHSFLNVWGRKARHSWKAEPVSRFNGLLQSSGKMLSILPSPSGGFCFHTSLKTQFRTLGGCCGTLQDWHNIRVSFSAELSVNIQELTRLH